MIGKGRESKMHMKIKDALDSAYSTVLVFMFSL